MKNKEEKSQKAKQSLYPQKLGFGKANWALLVLILLAFIVIFSLVYMVLSPYLNKKSIENDISNMETTKLLSVEKIVCYSSAYGINNDEAQARWNLNLSQYTDIAIYLNVQTNISNMYIDNISFSNTDTGNLSLSYLSIEDFAKSPIADSTLVQSDEDAENIIETNDNNLNTDINNTNINSDGKINLNLTLPITLRYLNDNLKENCLITDVDTPLSFDGSILKRGKVTLSSLKNMVSFTLHIVDNTNQEYVYPISISIPLENTEEELSIYDGSYMEENALENAYFYLSN